MNRRKLTNPQVMKVYRMLEAGATSQEIARKFNITINHISCIRTGKAYYQLYDLFQKPKKLTSLDNYKMVTKELEDFNAKYESILTEYHRLLKVQQKYKEFSKSLLYKAKVRKQNKTALAVEEYLN